MKICQREGKIETGSEEREITILGFTIISCVSLKTIQACSIKINGFICAATSQFYDGPPL
jgi:hypothetical protein